MADPLAIPPAPEPARPRPGVCWPLDEIPAGYAPRLRRRRRFFISDDWAGLLGLIVLTVTVWGQPVYWGARLAGAVGL